MSFSESGTYVVVEVRRRGPWRAEATVFRCEPGRAEAEALVTVAAFTRRGAKRRAARFIALGEEMVIEHG
jgi:hypothetical protein